MDTKKLSFEVDASQIDIKPLLKKEFLELTMRPISTANPNRNNSWFTRESLVASKDTFKNKPILGYFENGDFVSHNGAWKEDPETQLDYWDTTGSKGERPLGLIRENDEVEVIDDPETGLSWIVLTCALWTQYNYKQVKRLLKDAKKAKQDGGPTKNVSVEVDITDWEELDNGVMKINAFNLVGITILGSRNGVKVEPGIADAELSVVDIMGTELYEKRLNSLRLAYEKLDGSEHSNKEDFSEMEQPVLNAEVTTPVEETLTTQPEVENTAETSSQDAQFAAENSETVTTEPETIHENNEAQPEAPTQEAGETPAQEGEEVVHQQNESQIEIQDINWLLEKMSGVACSMECTLNYYKNYPEDFEGSEYIIPVLERIYKQTVENEKELIGLLAKVAEGLTEEDKAQAAAFAEHWDCKAEYTANCDLLCKYNDLVKECDALKESNKELECKFEAIEKAEAHANFMKEAKVIIANAKLSDEMAISFEKDCEEEKIGSLDELKTQIGLKLYEIAAAEQAASTEQEEPAPATTYSAPVETPDMSSFADETPKTKKDKWDRLREFNK